MSTKSDYIAVVNEGSDIGITEQPFILFRIWQKLMGFGSSQTYLNEVDETAQEISLGATKLRGLNIYNPNAYPVYLKFYDNIIGNIVIGSSFIAYEIMIPATGQVILDSDTIYCDFLVGMCISCTKLYNQDDTTSIDLHAQYTMRYSQ